jgi:hypothetical protein
MIGLRDRLGKEFAGETSGFSEGIISKIPLYIGASGISGYKGSNVMKTPGFWIKRGTALLCHKEE